MIKVRGASAFTHLPSPLRFSVAPQGIAYFGSPGQHNRSGFPLSPVDAAYAKASVLRSAKTVHLEGTAIVLSVTATGHLYCNGILED